MIGEYPTQRWVLEVLDQRERNEVPDFTDRTTAIRFRCPSCLVPYSRIVTQ